MYNSSRSQRGYYRPEETDATYSYSSLGSDSWKSDERVAAQKRYIDPKAAEDALVDLQKRLDDYSEEKGFKYYTFAAYSKSGDVHSNAERSRFLDMCDQHLNSYEAQLEKIPTHNNYRLVELNRIMNTDIKTYRGKVTANRESLRRSTDDEYYHDQIAEEVMQANSERLQLKQDLNKFGNDNCFNYADFATYTKDGQVRSDTERSRFLKVCDQGLYCFEHELKEIPTHNSPRLEGLQSDISLGIENYRKKVAASRGSVKGEIW
ncbi:hypothetical protein RSOL_425190, partial [Rhizoctonia solani AG-3 Rhs1AP]